jgi:hypothetical protein
MEVPSVVRNAVGHVHAAGEKFDLDCSESGERWTLPIHLLDAVFYTATGRASAFEDRGMAVEILKRISAVLSAGFASKALQRLPHITLLNLAWYHSNLKPLMAEWVYLWLQKQHLHGISRQEATTYMLEGAVARSEATGKVGFLGFRVGLCPSLGSSSGLVVGGFGVRWLVVHHYSWALRSHTNA